MDRHAKVALNSANILMLAALWIAAVGPAPVGAQTLGTREKGASPAVQDTQRKVLPLDEIVVTATRTGQVVREMPAYVTVLQEATIRRSSAGTVPDLLRTIPGLTTRDYQSSVSAHPTRMAPSLRGLGGGTSAGRTLVLMDGMPIADPFAGWVHWARVPLDLVQRIEIVRGGGSGIWGSRAMGGVINVITASPSTSGGQVSLQGGNMSTLKATGNVTHRAGALGLTVAANYTETEGFVGVKEDLRGPIDKPAGTRDGMAWARLEYAVSPTLGLNLSGSYLDESRAWGSDLREVGIELGFVRAGAHLLTAGRNEWKLDAFVSDQTYHSTFTSETLDRTTEQLSLDQFDVPATAAGATFQWLNRSSDRHTFTAGADVFWVDGEVNEDFLRVQNVFQRRRQVGGDQMLSGVFAQDLFRPTDRWRLLAAVRLDRAQRDNGFRQERVIATDALLVDSVYAKDSESTVNFSLGVRQELTGQLSWRANFYRAYRAPTLNELYKPFREPGNVVAEANSALIPEHVLGIEAGADLAVSDRFLARITAFWARVRDPIVEATIAEAGPNSRLIAPCGFVPAGGVCRQRQNLELFRTSGIETELTFQAHRLWSIEGTYVWNPTRVLSAPETPALEGSSGSRTPEHSATLSVQFADPDFVDATIMGRYVGRRFEDDLNQFDLDPFFLVDARVERSIGPRWNVFASVENIANEEYETARPSSGLVRVGAPRTLLIGSRVRW